MNWEGLGLLFVAVILAIGTFSGLYASWQQNKRDNSIREEVRKAEKAAFTEGPENTAPSMGKLFNLYSKQIEQYQEQTRSRATWSFIFAIVAMSAGLGFVFWGGIVMLSGTETAQVAVGSVIAGIGGAVSAFIVKTFLDVHRLSLTQLNRYFQQPVVNDHILMVQRLAEEVGDNNIKQKAYETMITSLVKLIDSTNFNK
jgi:hypothetical protein